MSRSLPHDLTEALPAPGPASRNPKRASVAGVALVSALLASLLVLAMLFLVTSLVIRDSRLSRNDG